MVRHIPFFWDTVQLGSKHAHFFLANNLQWTLLPPEIDSGHPPTFGYYLAWVWSVWGKTLPASHWAMFPFLALIVLLLYRLGRRLGTDDRVFWLMPLVLLDPVLAGQSALISPDIPLACFFLLALEGIWSERSVRKAVGILGLCLISMRGMMTAGALFIWQLALCWPAIRRSRSIPGNLLAFVPGFVAALGFLGWHAAESGWIGYHAGSPWAPAFEPVRGYGLFRNLLVLGWRWTDLGRIAEWAVLGYLFYTQRKRSTGSIASKPDLFSLALLLCCLILFLSPSAVLYRNLSAHRYFLPLFLTVHLLVFHWITHANIPVLRKNLLSAMLILALATGNLWIYPRGISMDWDSTLAHLPYHGLRAEMMAYLVRNNIDYEQIGTAFPNINTGENLLLNGDERLMAEKDFERNNYVMASNIFNDFSESDYCILARDWHLAKRLEHAGIWLELYQKPVKTETSKP